MGTENEKPVARSEPAYTKRQFLQSKEHEGQRDLIRALLKDDRSYTKSEVVAIIEKYRGKRV